MSASLPFCKSKHYRSLEIKNETSYDTRAIRKLVVRCLRALTLRIRGVVRLCYSTGESTHYGVAALGSIDRGESGYSIRSGLNMVLTVPRNPANFSKDVFAKVILHEALHWKGVEHVDMTENQRWCKGPAPAWANDVEVVFTVKAAPDPVKVLEKRRDHVLKMVLKATRRVRMARTLEKKWIKKLAAAERSILKKSSKLAVPQVPPSAQDSSSDTEGGADQ
jgi:hypothetical protein